MQQADFGIQLRPLRKQRGVSLATLARAISYSKGHLSNIERGARRPTPALARACDDFLVAEGALVALLAAPVEKQAPPAVSTLPALPRPLGVRPMQLPPVTADVVGREDDLNTLTSLTQQDAASRSRVVLVTGPAGMGKTTVALTWAHQHGADFSDGVLFADLHGFDVADSPVPAEEVLNGFLRELGVGSSLIPEGRDARAALFRTVTSGRCLLIVLDNAASPSQVLPLLPAAAGSLVMVTSRRELPALAIQAGARTHSVSPLRPNHSRALLERLIRDQGTTPGEAHHYGRLLEEIADLCCHEPLALRIAGYKIAAHPQGDLSSFTGQLRREELRLTTLDAGDTQTSVAGALNCSYAALSPAGAQLFRLLGAHPGAVILDGVATALMRIHREDPDQHSDSHGPPVKVAGLVQELVGLHLLDPVNEERLRMHDLVRLHARRQLLDAGSDGDQDGDLAMRWYLGVAAAADLAIAPWQVRPPWATPATDTSTESFTDTFVDRVSAFAWCDRNLDLLITVSRFAARAQSPVAWLLPLALAGYFKLRRPRGVWIDLHHTGFSVARAAGERAAEGWLANNLATAYYHVGEAAQAVHHFEEAASIRNELGDRPGEAWANLGLGYTLWHSGDSPTANRLFVAALPVLEEAGDVRGQGLLRVGLAGSAPPQRRVNAVSELHRALGLFDAAADDNGQALALHELGVLSYRAGQRTEAHDYLRRALTLREDSGDTAGAGESMQALADVLTTLGQRAAASRVRRQAAEILLQFQGRPLPSRGHQQEVITEAPHR